MDIDDFQKRVLFFTKRERGGWFTPEKISDLMHMAQMWLFVQELDVYAQTRIVQKSLSPFVVQTPFVTGADGVIQLPVGETDNPRFADFCSAYAMYQDTGKARYREIKFFEENSIAERLDSQTLEPSVNDPVGEIIGKGKVQLYPQANISGNVRWIKNPVKPVYAYTRSGADKRTITYDKAGSTQLEWLETDINKILVRTVQLAGVNIDDKTLLQYSEAKIQNKI